MKPQVDLSKKLTWGLPPGLDPLAPAPSPQPASSDHLANVLRLVGSSEEAGAGAGGATRASLPQDWASLIDRLRQAAGRAREVEAHAQDQELRVQELLERVREDMHSANERVRAAEARAADIQARADSAIRAAEERTKAAEERARFAEEWLFRVHETITHEFTGTQDSKLSA